MLRVEPAYMRVNKRRHALARGLGHGRRVDASPRRQRDLLLFHVGVRRRHYQVDILLALLVSCEVRTVQQLTRQVTLPPAPDALELR